MSLSLTDLAERYGTPFYAYDLDAASQRVAELKAVLPAGSRLLYSFKANPLPPLTAALQQAGCEADLTSPGELAVAQSAGFDLSRALYGGPGKGVEEIAAAIQAGVRQFSVESWQDLASIATAARRHGVHVTGVLRVNPTEAPRAALAMSGVSSQFGFEESELLAHGREKLAACADVFDPAGFHIYWGTQIGGAEALLDCFSAAVRTANALQAALGISLRYLNLGGGFPWPYATRGVGPDLTPLASGLADLRKQGGEAGKAQWWFESGRFLTASSGTLVARVMDLKPSKDKLYVILDTGIHHLGGMAGLGRIPRFRVDFEPLQPTQGEITAEIAGQLCTPLDCLARKAPFPDVPPGSLVSIPNVGAYGVTGSLVAFLSRPAPLEICLRHGVPVSLHRCRTGHESLSL